MTTDPKPLTRDELLAYAKLVVGDAYVADEALAALLRHCAALLPAEGAERMGVYRIPALPVNEEDETIVGAMLAKAQEGRTSTKMVARADLEAAIARAETAESALAQCERDLAQEIARADAAEKRVAELEKELQSDIELQARHLLEAPEDSLAPFAKELRARILAAGIRDGLEGAAVWLEKNTWNTHAPSFVRALKEQVK